MQSNWIFGALLLAYIVFITIRGELETYITILRGGGKIPAGQQSTSVGMLPTSIQGIPLEVLKGAGGSSGGSSGGGLGSLFSGSGGGSGGSFGDLFGSGSSGVDAGSSAADLGGSSADFGGNALDAGSAAGSY